MPSIDVKQLLSDEVKRREDERMANAAKIVEEAIKTVLPAAADALEGKPSQSPAASNGTSADSSVPGPPQPSSSQPSASSRSAHTQGLIQLAVQELVRYRPGSDEQLKALEEKSRHLSTLTGEDKQELAAKLANQLAQQPQPQPRPQPDDTTDEPAQSGIKSRVMNAFRSDDQG